ncbi:hypothetical protein QYE76_065623 [Lolium multiflorum]|uniref:CCHC-type domain-containing protein n=1 Tax=Lolium multiflorum TaxID=4521 RepID=A0AAD8SAN6_LOLMU|nr:hypothetical protein QYE76_065623 [Lolium multiflorum]
MTADRNLILRPPSSSLIPMIAYWFTGQKGEQAWTRDTRPQGRRLGLPWFCAERQIGVVVSRTRSRTAVGERGPFANDKRNFQSHKFKNKNKFEGKGKFDAKNKASQSTNFKKKSEKKRGVCHVCGDPDHWAPNCPNRFDKRQHGKGGKTANVVIGDIEMNDAGYGIFPTIISAAWTSSVLMGNGSHASIHGVGTIMESNDVTFFEDIFPMKDMSSSSHQEMPTSSSQELVPTPEPTISMEHVGNRMENNSETPKMRKRQRIAKSFGDDFIVYLVDGTPSSISEAYASPDADYWKEAVRSEMDSILANGTWEITDRLYGCMIRLQRIYNFLCSMLVL